VVVTYRVEPDPESPATKSRILRPDGSVRSVGRAADAPDDCRLLNEGYALGVSASLSCEAPRHVIERDVHKTRPYRVTTIRRDAHIAPLRDAITHAFLHLPWMTHWGVGCLAALLNDTGLRQTWVHLWHRDLATQPVPFTPLAHDHVFEMRSSVLAGFMVHDEWHLRETPRGAWKLFKVPRKTGDAFTEVPGTYETTVISSVIDEGEQYQFPAGAFHDAYPLDGDDPVVTVVTMNFTDANAHWIAPREMTEARLRKTQFVRQKYGKRSLINKARDALKLACSREPERGSGGRDIHTLEP
jgi:hypothetical protein